MNACRQLPRKEGAMSVGRICQREVDLADLDESVQTAAERRLPVVETEGKLVGLARCSTRVLTNCSTCRSKTHSCNRFGSWPRQYPASVASKSFGSAARARGQDRDGDHRPAQRREDRRNVAGCLRGPAHSCPRRRSGPVRRRGDGSDAEDDTGTETQWSLPQPQDHETKP